MESCYPAYPLPAPATDGNELWYPGSPSYASPPPQEQMELARLRYKQELQKLYENTPESSYDLSLKDIVDPVITISGNLTANAAQEGLTSHAQAGLSDGKNKSWKTTPIAKLLLSFYFPGFSAKLKRSPSYDNRAISASKQCLKANLSISRFSNGSPEANSSSSSKIHPSNQCSSCSSFTVFFKTHCFVCGRLYCSICAKECMDSLSSSFKCKGTCKNDPLKKRFSQKMASSCWPVGSNFNVPRSKHKTINTHCTQRFFF